MDGNTRLCTATSAMALMESFGSDGDPGSYTDLDITDTILHIGHNPALLKQFYGHGSWIGSKGPILLY